jgi:hypothetical protein
MQCAVRARAPYGHLDLRVVHGEHLRISRFLPDAVKVHRPQNESECRWPDAGRMMAVSLPLKLPLRPGGIPARLIGQGTVCTRGTRLGWRRQRVPLTITRQCLSSIDVANRYLLRRHHDPSRGCRRPRAGTGAGVSRCERDEAGGLAPVRARVVQAPSPPELHLSRAMLPRPSPRHSSRARRS